ncbi:hypothetical protein Aduo_001443 [Ancylostoma duodenale]
MATFRASKSQLASALTELNKFTDRIPANLLQPFILNAGAGVQIRVLVRRKNSIITAKSSIENALTLFWSDSITRCVSLKTLNNRRKT